MNGRGATRARSSGAAASAREVRLMMGAHCVFNARVRIVGVSHGDVAVSVAVGEVLGANG